MCLIGWQGPDCSQCRPNWKCPNQNPSATDESGNPRIPACILPNQCFCDKETEVADNSGYCNWSELNGDSVMPNTTTNLDVSPSRILDTPTENLVKVELESNSNEAETPTGAPTEEDTTAMMEIFTIEHRAIDDDDGPI